jgi:hypothetical protein
MAPSWLKGPTGSKTKKYKSSLKQIGVLLQKPFAKGDAMTRLLARCRQGATHTHEVFPLVTP